MRWILSLALLLFCIALQGQTNFGIALGLDNTKFSGEKPDELSYQFRRSLSIYGFVDFQLADKVQLSIRPGYANGGVNVALKDTVGLNNEDPFVFPIKDSYLNLAALFKIYNKGKVYAIAGPELGYLFTSKARINDIEVDLSEQLNQLVLGLDIGFGLNFNMFEQAWSAEWQLTQMLTTLTKKEDIASGISPKLRTTRTRLALIYKFKKP